MAVEFLSLMAILDEDVIISENHPTTEANYDVIRLGAQYADLRETLKALQKEGYAIKGFGDMSAEEVAQAMGLSVKEAKMAKRETSMSLFLQRQEEKSRSLFDSIKMKGFNVTKGRIYHLLGAKRQRQGRLHTHRSLQAGIRSGNNSRAW